MCDPDKLMLCEDKKCMMEEERVLVKQALKRQEGASWSDDSDVDNNNNDLIQYLSRLGRFLGEDNSYREVELIGSFLKRGSFIGAMIWLCCLAFVGFATPAVHYEYLQGLELNASIVLLCLLVVTNGSRILPLMIRHGNLAFVKKSGVITGLLVVQAISVASTAMMVFLPVPVMVDPLSGIRIHLSRFAEWTACAFLMTFLTESIDLSLQKQQRGTTTTAWLHAISMTLSTSAGLFFPFAQNKSLWWIVMIASWILFFPIYIRLWQRRNRLCAMDQGTQAAQRETYYRSLYSFRIMVACTVTWTAIAASFCVCCILPSYATTTNSFLGSPAMPLLCQHFFHAMSKIWYLSLLVEVHEHIFDENARALRRLEDLRGLMSAVWDNSTDVIARVIQNNSPKIDVFVSPAFIKLERVMQQQQQSSSDTEDETVVLEVDRRDGSFRSFTVNLSKQITRDDVCKLRNDIATQSPRNDDIFQKNLAAMAELVTKACALKETTDNDSLLMQEFYAKDNDGTDAKLNCEAKVTSLPGAILVLLRDISERFRRFEAEKRLVEEATVRRKDAEANRFTRHEIKNGLLAAIGIVDSIRDNATTTTTVGHDKNKENNAPENQSAESPARDSLTKDVKDIDELFRNNFDMCGSLNELDQTLREVLETVLDEVMCREIVYEEYQPRSEAMDVPAFLSKLVRRGDEYEKRFPLVVEPAPFPRLRFDPRLLRYIHRNAVSNACKFGEVAGVVETRIFCNAETFRMEVINLPGPGHDALVELADDEAAAVFHPRTQLDVNHFDLDDSIRENRVRRQSSGDGAWIMQECAKTLGGACKIRFEEKRTVFSFECTADVVITRSAADKVEKTQAPFRIPQGTWGIAIDDSNIQRKIMNRFITNAGIEDGRKMILGGTREEVEGFGEILEELIISNPDDKFLVIVDENLDVIQGGAHIKTISGSLSVKALRGRLKPEDECRLLTLVRSANDSADEVASYKSRAHGVIEKAPVGKNGITEMIKPWWVERFPSSRFSGAVDGTTLAGIEDDGGYYCASPEDIFSSVDVVNALFFVSGGSSLKARWGSIRDKLHVLKGDLMTIRTSEEMKDVLRQIDLLLSSTATDNALERWQEIHSSIRGKLSQ